ncbi:type I-E CRISPR-associated protein Cas6/Cse3/CasE [Glycomyces arizonensis]|uniref:type I-E CRISPR-associated protein Cas6/Cse3/CasE n=1 Tax=Glycomyces arizonensis TaxID=256035 RepID=UPI000406638D|nr:type I-E CRISPR-associated protein Cas6/Cse3/CasE [Glycomyces arizonensis]
MYLTRMRLNTARRGAQKLLGSPQAMHAAVLHGFPGDEAAPGGGARTMWRLDRNDRHDALLYLLSATEPDLTHLVEQAGWPTRSDGWETRPYGPLLERLEAGQHWAFRLTANPTFTRHHHKKEGERGERFSHLTATQQTEWLLRKAERCGFTVPPGETGEPNLVLRERQQRRFHRAKAKAPVTLSMATFEGVLEVKDPAVMRQVMLAGIGRAKAYGCGLLTLASAR